MKYILTETQLKLLVEQANESSLSCDKNVSNVDGYSSVWKSMDPKKRDEIIKSLNNEVNRSLIKSRDEYTKWFQNPATIKKFKTPKEQEILKKIPAFLQSIKRTNYTINGPKAFPNARAWVSNKEMDLINYNLGQIHNGREFVGQSVEYTTKHEMGHLIDYFFKNNGVQTYINTTNADEGEGYAANYLVADSDQYTRLNVLRGIIGAGPNDHPITLLNKFLAQVKSGKITSNKFNFSAISSPTPGISQKNNAEQANEVNRLLYQSIFVDGKNNHNIEQLFTNFGLVKNGNVYVSFDLLAQFNVTAKDLEKKYYLLKMVPK
jgi:hypothetical protein